MKISAMKSAARRRSLSAISLSGAALLCSTFFLGCGAGNDEVDEASTLQQAVSSPDNQIWWHESATGAVQVWFMNGATRTGVAQSALNGGPGWRPVSMADFNGDTASDILWHRGSTGELQIWYMNGVNRINFSNFNAVFNRPDSSGWRVAGTNDFNQDGQADILWHNSDGRLHVWMMSGSTPVQFVDFSPLLNTPDSTGWRIVGTDDFNLDGRTDILWHKNSGEILVWYLNGTNFLNVGNFTLTVPDSLGWRAVGTNDLNVDGRPDVLWHHNTNTAPAGGLQIWYMNNVTRTGFTDFSLAGGPGWSVINR
jgi:hypothetical protein